MSALIGSGVRIRGVCDGRSTDTGCGSKVRTLAASAMTSR